MVKLKIKAAKPKIKLKKDTFSVKEKSLKDNNKTITLKSVGKSGKLTYKKASGKKYITVSKDGKLTVKKGNKERKIYN